MKRNRLYLAGIPLFATLLLTGCEQERGKSISYEVTVTNLSEGQPFSPPAVILHHSGYRIWQVGTAASNGLEHLAEGGETAGLLAEAEGNDTVVSTAADITAILPGASSSVIIEGVFRPNLELSLATMLVNTNDGFTGLDAVDVGSLNRHQSRTFMAIAYDAGTEANSEAAATVPGPAAGGEGYNSARDDHDRVGVHPGVISSDDGLSGSALISAHRFDNPVARITVTRLE